jgi:hypothetical protein
MNHHIPGADNSPEGKEIRKFLFARVGASPATPMAPSQSGPS